MHFQNQEIVFYDHEETLLVNGDRIPPTQRQKHVVRRLENLRTLYKYAQFSQHVKKSNIIRERGNEFGKDFLIEKGKKD